MTLKVYEVNRAGITRVLRPAAPVVPATTADPSAAYPDCKCPRHRAGDESAYRAYLSHTMFCGSCLAGAACVTAVKLGRVWRDSR
jgi:hypothetical protein